jgi:PAS domain S-box-containing protein
MITIRGDGEAMQSRAFYGLPVIGLLTLVYFIAGKVGLMLASLHASASPVWPTAGIALAALLLLGYRAWPAIFVGAFLVNVTTAGNVATSLAVASGNTLEAVCGAWLVNRFAGGTTAFDRPQGVFRFAIAAVVSTIISPAFGVTSLALAGFAGWTNYGAISLTWWLGDITGDLLIAPLIILWSIASKQRWSRKEAVEVGILLLLFLILSEVVFGGWFAISARNYPIAFISGSIVIWTAFRFTPRETATGIFILSAIAIWGTMNGFGPFVGETHNQSLLLLQSWTAVLTITALALSAGMAERGRTAEALRESEARISLAANTANLGLWVWKNLGDELWVTEEWRKMFGFTDSKPVMFDRLLEIVHPGDRERMKQIARQMFEHGGEYENEYRITWPDGTLRWIAGHGSVELDERGKVAFARGVSRDITKRKTAEDELRESEERFRTVADAAPVLIWMAGVDKLCTFFNKPWLEFTGRSLEQELGNGWAEGVHPDDLQKCLKIYTEAFDARKAFVMRYRLRRYDGEYRWISDQGVARYDSNGKFSGYIGSCVDVTDLINKDEALREFEERVVLAAEATHHGVWELDTDTNEVWMSDKARYLFQFDPEARLDMAIVQRRVHPDDRALRESAIKQAIETQGDYALEYRLLLPDGTLRWISGRGRCVTGKHGKGKRLIGVSVDITEQKEAQDLFRLAAEGSHLGVWHWDEIAKTLTWDRATRDMFGVSADGQITIDTFYRALHPDDAQRVKQTWRQALELRLPYQIEFRTKRTDGTIRWVDARGQGYYDEAGKPLWMTGVLFDITDRKEAELQAQQNRDELSHLSRVAAMGELAASIAHELNQPLSGITSNAAAGQRFIDRGKVDLRELHDLLGDIVADGRRAGDVIRGIQGMVKKDISARRRINLNDIVISVLHMVKPSAMLHSCELGTFLDPDLPTVEGDPVQMQQVLLNLIINAFDAMRDVPRSRRKVIIATERDVDGATRVSVRDYGVGISEQARARLFEQFFTTKSKGLGMGLSIVRSIVESHRGTITAEDADGGGARFQFAIPAYSRKVSE